VFVTFAVSGGNPSATSTGKESSDPPPANALTAPESNPTTMRINTSRMPREPYGRLRRRRRAATARPSGAKPRKA
jgi:hypothetical protein